MFVSFGILLQKFVVGFFCVVDLLFDKVLFIFLYFNFFFFMFSSFFFPLHVLEFHCRFFVLVIFKPFLQLYYDEAITICVVDSFHTSTIASLECLITCYEVEPNEDF